MPEGGLYQFFGDPIQPSAPPTASTDVAPGTKTLPVPPVPEGAMADPVRREVATNYGKNIQDIYDKATNGVDFIRQVGHLRDQVNEVDEKDPVFGGFNGSGAGRALNKMNAAMQGGLGKVPTINSPVTGRPIVGGTDYKKIVDQQESLQASYDTIAIPLARAMFGNIRASTGGGGRSPMDEASLVERGMSVLGGLGAVDKKAALHSLEQGSLKAWDAIHDGIQYGQIKPQDLPFNIIARNPSEAHALGLGAVFINPNAKNLTAQEKAIGGRLWRNPSDRKEFDDQYRKFLPGSE